MMIIPNFLSFDLGGLRVMCNFVVILTMTALIVLSFLAQWRSWREKKTYTIFTVLLED